MATVNFENAGEYFKSLNVYPSINNISCVSYDISADIKNIEIMINRVYFCSVGLYDRGAYEVFELHHGAKVSEDGREWLTDGELWQYCVYKSLKCAINFALKCAKRNELPNKAIKTW